MDCRFFRLDVHNHPAWPHHCAFVDAPFDGARRGTPGRELSSKASELSSSAAEPGRILDHLGLISPQAAQPPRRRVPNAKPDHLRQRSPEHARVPAETSGRRLEVLNGSRPPA